MSRTHVTGTIVGLERTGETRIGNPIFTITIMLDSAEFESFITKANGSVVDNIRRFEPDGTGDAARVTLTLTGHGRVADITPA